MNSGAPDFTYAKAAYEANNLHRRRFEATSFDELDLATKVVWYNTAAAACRASGTLYLHAKKRLADEFGIELTEEWEHRVAEGEHDVPFPYIEGRAQYVDLLRALNNVRMTAVRMKRRIPAPTLTQGAHLELEQRQDADLDHILRFCSEVGVVGSVLRDNAQQENADAAQYRREQLADMTGDNAPSFDEQKS